MSLERAEWVVGYLVGKIVRIVDLKDFFTIQNNELKIKVEEINSKRYSYTFGGFTFIVDIEEVEAYEAVASERFRNTLPENRRPWSESSLRRRWTVGRRGTDNHPACCSGGCERRNYGIRPILS